MGKTVSIISLILTLRSPPHFPHMSAGSRRLLAGTLIGAPTIVIHQWADELEKKVSKEAKLTCLVYHGSDRTIDVDELASYDVVVTTYAIVTKEALKRRREDVNGKSTGESNVGPLGKINWYRVVLDEAQQIKNRRARVSWACWNLRANRRWCLSGTPMQNSVDDLYSYFRFLRYGPYSSFGAFNEMIKYQTSYYFERNKYQTSWNSQIRYRKLQAILNTIMLRRTKGTLLDGKPIIDVQPKTVGLTTIEFSPDKRSFYSALEGDSAAQFKIYINDGTVVEKYGNVLEMLLRLRQACNHPLLVKGLNTNVKWRSSVEETSLLPKEKQEHLLSCLEASSAICALCVNDAQEDAVVTTCRHVFCNQCISQRLTSMPDEKVSCPVCKSGLSFSLFTRTTLKSSLSGNPIPVKQESGIPTSAKIRAALQILHSLPPIEGGDVKKEENRKTKGGFREKSLVFSQWTSMLDLMEPHLKESGLEFRRLDGTMSVAAREKAISEFNTIPEITVMLMSLRAASLGLNMVVANNVILLDPWWNPTTEDQAIDRVHRIGQTRPVTVYRLTVEDTVEDRILDLQEKKRKMVASAFGEGESGSRTKRLTIEDLKYLFRVN